LFFSKKVSSLGLDPGLGLGLALRLKALAWVLALSAEVLAWVLVLPVEVLALTLQALLTSLLFIFRIF